MKSYKLFLELSSCTSSQLAQGFCATCLYYIQKYIKNGATVTDNRTRCLLITKMCECFVQFNLLADQLASSLVFSLLLQVKHDCHYHNTHKQLATKLRTLTSHRSYSCSYFIYTVRCVSKLNKLQVPACFSQLANYIATSYSASGVNGLMININCITCSYICVYIYIYI